MLIALIVVLSAISSVLALVGKIIFGLVLIFACITLYEKVRQKQHNPDLAVLSFANNMLANYSPNGSFTMCVLKSLDQGMWFYEDIKRIVRKYIASGSLPNNNLHDGYYGELLAIIAMGLEGSKGVREAIELLSHDMEAEQEIRSKYSGSAYNAFFISSMGSVVFFPIFAGISYYIMGFQTGIAHTHPIGIAEYSFIIMFFVLETLLYRAMHSGRIASSIPGIALSMSVAALLFKTSYLISVGALRW
jgi:hypothetical protein